MPGIRQYRYVRVKRQQLRNCDVEHFDDVVVLIWCRDKLNVVTVSYVEPRPKLELWYSLIGDLPISRFPDFSSVSVIPEAQYRSEIRRKHVLSLMSHGKKRAPITGLV